jgi:hypothetical protein
MSFEPPAGILDIGNATLRVGKLEVAETSGLNQGLQNIVKNDLLVTETTSYTTNQVWGIKLPTAWVGEFDLKGASTKYVEFNFYNEGSTSNAQGYTLNFKDTSLTLKYDNGNNLTTATIPTIVGTFRKVNIFFERGVIAVSIDGTQYLYYKESNGFNNGLGVASRVLSTTGGSFVNAFFESDHGGNSEFKNLRIVNGRFISDETNNIAFVGGNLGVGVNSPQEALDIRGNMHFNRVSNVSQISVDSNVVTEYTGPHDRPLRKYPEVAFLGDGDLTQFGYTASSSGQFGVTYPASNAFTGTATTTQNAWVSPMSTFETTQTNNGSVANSSRSFTGAPSGEQNGPWLKIELPNAIKLSYSKIYRWHASSYNTRLKDGYIYGSNDDSTYTRLVRLNNLGTSWNQYTGTTINVNATEHYKYYVLHVTEIYQTDNTSAASSPYVTLGEWELYGYEEGSGSLDTTLKSVYNVPATTGTQLEVYYDAKDLTTMPSTVTDLAGGDQNGTVTGHSPTLDTTDGINSFVFDGTDDYIDTNITTGTGAWSHTIAFWIKIDQNPSTTPQCVFQIKDSSLADNVDPSFHTAPSLIINHTTRTLNYAFFGNPGHLLDDNGNRLVAQTGVWQHYVLQYDASNGGTNYRDRKIIINGNKEYYPASGTATALSMVASNKLFIGCITKASTGGVGEFFDGSIANFRLYSKALNAGQIKELYDYQKDYFLGSKSQVTLYKGHLGVGVTEPSSQLELAGDERLQEYPPGPMGPSTSYETHIPGHGVFCWDTVNYYSGSPVENFNGSGMYAKDGATTGWYGPYNNNNGYTGGNVYAGTDFAATSSSGLGFNDAYGNRYYGAWTTFKLPYKINLKKIHIDQFATSDGANARCAPEDGVILGSNNGVDWYHVHTFIGLQYGGSAGNPSYSAAGEDVTITCTTDYSQYALVITRTLHYDFTALIGELKWFGTPSSTTLDKGSLTLGRSLDVPRISRYDVDTETPRPEKLVLDFDTTVNSSPTDISGKGNHGTFVNGASYSPADKAFSFDGVNDYITASVTDATGDWVHSTSYWFKLDTLTNGHYFHFITGDSSNPFGTLIYFTNKFTVTAYSSEVYASETSIEIDRWYHVVVVYRGGGLSATNTDIYLDGIKETVTGTNVDTPELTGTLYVGSRGTVDHFDGQISNFKIYDVALEPSEVKKLYNLGRTGRSMVISDTAVGIGKVPEAQLDVRGNLRVGGAISSNNPGWSYWKTGKSDQNDIIYGSATDGPVTFNNLEDFGQNWETGVAGTSTERGTGHNFDPSTGKYTAPEKGVYLVQFCWTIEGGDGTDDSQYAMFVTSGNKANGGSWESGGSFPNRTTNSSAYMQFNPRFSTRSGIEECWCISDLILLDKGSTVQVHFRNVSSTTTLTVNRANFSGIKIA